MFCLHKLLWKFNKSRILKFSLVFNYLTFNFWYGGTVSLWGPHSSFFSHFVSVLFSCVLHSCWNGYVLQFLISSFLFTVCFILCVFLWLYYSLSLWSSLLFKRELNRIISLIAILALTYRKCYLCMSLISLVKADQWNSLALVSSDFNWEALN